MLQRPEPELLDSVPHAAESARAIVEPIVLIVAVELLRQGGLLLANRVVPVRLDPRLDLANKAFARLDARLSGEDHLPAAIFRQVVDEAKESEGRRFLNLLPAPLQQASVEVQHRRLLRGDAQPKGCQSLFHFAPKSLRVGLVLKRRYVVVCEPGQLSEASAGLLEPSLEPQVQHVVQIDVGKDRTDGTPLRDALI